MALRCRASSRGEEKGMMVEPQLFGRSPSSTPLSHHPITHRRSLRSRISDEPDRNLASDHCYNYRVNNRKIAEKTYGRKWEPPRAALQIPARGRIETIILELATASVRHDNEFSRINNQFNQINTTIKEIAEQQQQSAIHYEQRFAQNDQAIANLTASIQELRNVVTDYIQGCSQL